MTPAEFQLVVHKIRPYTDYVYLHVLGEPLTHPQLSEILSIAALAGLFVNITTNGSRLKSHREALLANSVRQINISLHDAEENVAKDNWERYLDDVIDFAVIASPSVYVSLRLWNTTNKKSEEFIQLATNKVFERFKVSAGELNLERRSNGVKLADHIFFQSSPRFDWPDASAQPTYTYKTCYALKDHIAILSNGSVVPCCLDADANLLLGNIFDEDMATILANPRANKMKTGFEQRKAVEPFCSTCGFIVD
jgi:radical SAM protein with 4Fe4S-binding SPASM domain